MTTNWQRKFLSVNRLISFCIFIDLIILHPNSFPFSHFSRFDRALETVAWDWIEALLEEKIGDRSEKLCAHLKTGTEVTDENCWVQDVLESLLEHCFESFIIHIY
jgi:hypothetical protein